MAGAEQRFRGVLRASAGYDGTWNNLAAALLKRECLPAAEAAARRAVALSPNVATSWATLGAVLWQEQRYREARTALDHALLLDPRHVDALHNRALLHYETGDLTASLADFQLAHSIYGDAAPAVFLADMCYPVIALGDWRAGWALAEHRWCQLGRSVIWDLGIPEWQGESLAGKRILVHQDQGFGDAIHWLRLIPQLREMARSVVLAVPRPLVRLLGDAGYHAVDIDAERMPEADLHVPFSSLPHRLGLTPDQVSSWSYLTASHRSGIRVPMSPKMQLRVGIVWSADQRQQYGRRKSMPLTSLLPLALIPGVQLYSLQVGPAQQDIEALGCGAFVCDMADQIRDFADTADIVDQMHVVVTIDSAVLHLASAMGKPTIGLLPFVPCWRWPRDRSDNPWYGSLHLLHQANPGDWGPQVTETVRLLRERMERREAA